MTKRVFPIKGAAAAGLAAAVPIPRRLAEAVKELGKTRVMPDVTKAADRRARRIQAADVRLCLREGVRIVVAPFV
ncbi:MAG TPA: hypothetical protein VN282_24495 [Pyrinomonadaceae bacterium]|nr:hypothetical protein [Pyrinomonadaceae bacterium]